MAAAGGISCNADHHRGFNSVQLFQAVSPDALLGVVDFFNGKTKGRFDLQAMLDQCQMLATYPDS